MIYGSWPEKNVLVRIYYLSLIYFYNAYPHEFEPKLFSFFRSLVF